jgi:rod shape-determining protein MreC
MGVSTLRNYFNLRNENIRLAEENAQFDNLRKSNFKENFVTLQEIKDTIYRQQYFFFAARVVNNSVNKKHNYLTINRGRIHGVKPDMAVVTSYGVVGIVRDVSTNFSSVISVLNVNFGLSAKIKKNGYFGSISWDGEGSYYVNLSDIPNHVNIQKGDTIITSGYSSMFPEGYMVGTIAGFQPNPGGNFYDIKVKLALDFHKLDHVFVVGNYLSEETKALEKSFNSEN